MRVHIYIHKVYNHVHIHKRIYTYIHIYIYHAHTRTSIRQHTSAHALKKARAWMLQAGEEMKRCRLAYIYIYYIYIYIYIYCDIYIHTQLFHVHTCAGTYSPATTALLVYCQVMRACCCTTSTPHSLLAHVRMRRWHKPTTTLLSYCVTKKFWCTTETLNSVHVRMCPATVIYSTCTLSLSFSLPLSPSLSLPLSVSLCLSLSLSLSHTQ